MKVSELKNYKNSLYAGLSRDLSEFEKNFLLISAGTFTISITFIKDIVKLETAEFLPLLFSGWSLIGIATGLIMFAFLSSVNASNKLWKHVDQFLIINQKFDDSDSLTISEAEKIKKETNDILYNSKNILKTYRYSAVVFFLLGITCLAIFIGSNIIKDNKNPSIKKVNNNEKKAYEKKIILNLKEYQIISNDSSLILNQIKSENGTKEKSRKYSKRRNKQIICCYQSRDTEEKRDRETDICRCNSCSSIKDTCQSFK